LIVGDHLDAAGNDHGFKALSKDDD
jgi:hypothetical protein